MSTYKLHITVFFMGLFPGPIAALAQPSLFEMQEIAGQKLFRDIKKTNTYYYIPGDYRLATDLNGKPELSLLQMRYTGTRTGGDQGAYRLLNLLQFHVTSGTNQKWLNEVRSILHKTHRQVELKIFPIVKFSSLLVFAGMSSPSATEGIKLIACDYSEAFDEQGEVNNSYWNDRIITMRLTDDEATIIEAALRNRQSIISFSYAMYSEFLKTNGADLNITGNSNLLDTVKDYFMQEFNHLKDSTKHVIPIKTTAFGIHVDLGKWPALIKKIDINENIPARYAVFDVYCHDFTEELRPDLYAKSVEIEATGVNGTPITTIITFKKNQPDIFARSVRFKYAIRFDRPYKYRIREITNEGVPFHSEWIEKKDWIGFLDITSSPSIINSGSNNNQ